MPDTPTKPSDIDPHAVHIRSAQFVNISTGPLTDKKIEKYIEQGWYSESFRELRRQRMNRSKRKGNFVENDGRLIYSPV